MKNNMMNYFHGYLELDIMGHEKKVAPMGQKNNHPILYD